eukprot:scaffold12152_cov25-Tisochrysis_lutea.AAC.1
MEQNFGPKFGAEHTSAHARKNTYIHRSCRVQVGDWANALEIYVRQQQQHAAWQPTPEGLNAFRAGRASGFADGYKSGMFASILHDLHGFPECTPPVSACVRKLQTA